MKIKFTARPLGGRPEYKIGDEVEFNGRVEEAYAQKYIDRGWAEDISPKVSVAEAETSEADEAAAEAAAEAARLQAEADKLAERAAVEIPDDWSKLPYVDQRALAASLTDETVRSKDDIAAVINAELQRRAAE
ncbi:hypothetical protein [Mesorhizobium sp. B263B2A]|uniref:hypothetical protein n=1 Tax=Mesorhizobium sp. B263B2A TaxID=2876669 RepID=UPI001CD098A3|nr:hypothetical protein [Mesorhizobium sp. B263B2A]MCA0032748.1 hypothetical protein [Mesorhizobium sp. B263B2A]